MRDMRDMRYPRDLGEMRNAGSVGIVNIDHMEDKTDEAHADGSNTGVTVLRWHARSRWHVKIS